MLERKTKTLNTFYQAFDPKRGRWVLYNKDSRIKTAFGVSKEMYKDIEVKR
jgi:hypothetical protein